MRHQRLVASLLDLDRELCPNDGRQSGFQCRGVEPHRSAQLVVIGDRERGQPELHGARDEHLRKRGAIEQREAGMTVKFRVLHEL